MAWTAAATKLNPASGIEGSGRVSLWLLYKELYIRRKGFERPKGGFLATGDEMTSQIINKSGGLPRYDNDQSNIVSAREVKV